MKLSKHDFTNENALTLAEVLASVVILTIVLILFSSIYTQSWKSTNRSGAIVDATYLAQVEMENMYSLSKSVEYALLEEELDGLDYETQPDEDGWKVYSKDLVDNGEVVSHVKFKEDEDSQLIRVIVQIFEESETSPSVQMENYMNWKVTD